MNNAAAEIIVRGEVQGVGFRWFAHRKAMELRLVGFVENRSDGSVEVHAEGDRGAIEALIGALHVGPRAARVENVSVAWTPPSGNYTQFQISHD
ncbi:MAG TPA: acylphosphatase [Bacteroidota bacterium]|nr:acylphosphatase [Bacteroidota bacterium]